MIIIGEKTETSWNSN